MKQIKFLLAFVLLTAISNHSFTKGGGGGHSSGGHMSEGHFSEGESSHSFSEQSSHSFFNESHPYERVNHINESDIHSARTNNNLLIYYILLFNHHTNRYDTIKADSKEQLNTVVKEKTSDVPTMLIIGVMLIIVCFVGLLHNSLKPYKY